MIVHVLGAVLVFVAVLHLYLGLFAVPVTGADGADRTAAEPRNEEGSAVPSGAVGERVPSPAG